LTQTLFWGLRGGKGALAAICRISSTGQARRRTAGEPPAQDGADRRRDQVAPLRVLPVTGVVHLGQPAPGAVFGKQKEFEDEVFLS
jgi:hypothetical protein